MWSGVMAVWSDRDGDGGRMLGVVGCSWCHCGDKETGGGIRGRAGTFQCVGVQSWGREARFGAAGFGSVRRDSTRWNGSRVFKSWVWRASEWVDGW